MTLVGAECVKWKQRHAFRLTNGRIEATILLGGGHIADLRLCGSTVNALWEAPWPTIEPHHFSDAEHTSLYGEGAVGQMLSGYTGHAVCLGYFGMPSPEQEAQGLPLHGEAVTAEWRVAESHADDTGATVTLEAELPRTALHFRRTLSVASEACSVAIRETVSNRSAYAREIQLVQHATFGEPLFAGHEASLSLSGTRGLTWPLGYEGHALLTDDQPFEWPVVPSAHGDVDLSQPFTHDGTGFIAAVQPDRDQAFIAVHNRQLGLAAGYVYDAHRFPWICLWEENRARSYPPWNGVTRARGVEFGTSPFPTGLEHAREMQTLFDTPVLVRMERGGELSTSYDLFITTIPADWHAVADVRPHGKSIMLHSESGDKLRIARTSSH